MRLYTILQLGILLSILLLIFYLYSIRLINHKDIDFEYGDLAKETVTTEVISYKKLVIRIKTNNCCINIIFYLQR